jgi:hypothetical protein
MRARPVGLIALWVAVTAVLTTTAWLAVEVVADEVGGAPTTVLSASAVTSAAQDASASQSPAPTASPSLTPAHSPSPSSSPKPTSKPHTSPSASHATSSPKPTASSHNGGSGGSGGGGGGSGGGSSAVSKTFAVQGGTVAASCTGAAVSLKSAQPTNGWQVEVKDRGPEELEVAFRSDEDETEVTIHCSGGVPVLHTGGDDGSDD